MMLEAFAHGSARPPLCHAGDDMASDLERQPTADPLEPATLAAAISAYIEAMAGTGVDLDEDFETAALASWTDLDDPLQTTLDLSA